MYIMLFNEIYLGQRLSETLSLANGEWNEMIVFLDSPLAIQEPLRSESCPITPVVSLQYLGEQRLEQLTRQHY